MTQDRTVPGPSKTCEHSSRKLPTPLTCTDGSICYYGEPACCGHGVDCGDHMECCGSPDYPDAHEIASTSPDYAPQIVVAVNSYAALQAENAALRAALEPLVRAAHARADVLTAQLKRGDRGPYNDIAMAAAAWREDAVAGDAALSSGHHNSASEART